jgi:hypothetical protein
MVCLAYLAEARIDGRIIAIGRLAFQNATRTEFGLVSRILGIIRQLGLFLGVQMIEIAEELIEAIHGRQRLVTVAHVVLAKLSRGVAEVLEQAANGRIELVHAHWGAGKADLGQASADPVLPRQKGGAPGGAGLLAIVMLELDALTGDPIDARSFITHQPIRVGADIGDADIIAPNDEDIWLTSGRGSGCWRGSWSRCSFLRLSLCGRRHCRHCHQCR